MAWGTLGAGSAFGGLVSVCTGFFGRAFLLLTLATFAWALSTECLSFFVIGHKEACMRKPRG